MERTEAGMVLYKKTEGIFQHFDETITEVKETGEGLRGKLSIGCVKCCFSYIPRRMHLFLKKYPKVTFELREGDSYRLAELLNERHIDLAIVRLSLNMTEISQFLLLDVE